MSSASDRAFTSPPTCGISVMTSRGRDYDEKCRNARPAQPSLLRGSAGGLMSMTTDRRSLLVEWRRRVRAGWGLGPHWHTIDGTAPLVSTLLDGSADPCAVLAELGRRCGHDGHPLDQVTAWTGELIDVLPRRLRRKVDQRRAAVALAKGWSEGALERRHGRGAVAPMGVLQLALEHAY